MDSDVELYYVWMCVCVQRVVISVLCKIVNFKISFLDEFTVRWLSKLRVPYYFECFRLVIIHYFIIIYLLLLMYVNACIVMYMPIYS